jgi:DNA-binding MarR family transcriptional regulator
MLDINEIKEMRLMIMESKILFTKLIEEEISKKISNVELGSLENLGKQQKKIILIIGMTGEMIPSSLGLYMNMDRSSLSRMIDSMEKKGIVSRRADVEDRRKVMISLTEKGEEYYKILVEKVEEAQVSLLSLLDEQDLKEYKACIKTEISILKKIDSKLEEKE